MFDYLGGKTLVDHFLAVSNFQKNKLVHMGMSPEKISVLYNFSATNSPPSDLQIIFYLLGG